MIRRLGLASLAALMCAALPFPAGPPDAATRGVGLDRAALGDAAGAYELLAPWVAGHPDDAEATGALAAVATQLGRYDEAWKLLQRLPAGEPRLDLLGADLALLRGEPRVAIARLAAHDPQEHPVLAREFRRILGQAHVEIGQPDKALDILGPSGQDPVLGLWRGRALFLSGRFDEAVAELTPFAEQIQRIGVDKAPESQRSLMAEILIADARGLLACGHAREAVEILEPNVVSLGSRRAWHLLAQALVASGRGDEARGALNRGAALTKPAT